MPENEDTADAGIARATVDRLSGNDERREGDSPVLGNNLTKGVEVHTYSPQSVGFTTGEEVRAISDRGPHDRQSSTSQLVSSTKERPADIFPPSGAHSVQAFEESSRQFDRVSKRVKDGISGPLYLADCVISYGPLDGNSLSDFGLLQEDPDQVPGEGEEPPSAQPEEPPDEPPPEELEKCDCTDAALTKDYGNKKGWRWEDENGNALTSEGNKIAGHRKSYDLKGRNFPDTSPRIKFHARVKITVKNPGQKDLPVTVKCAALGNKISDFGEKGEGVGDDAIKANSYHLTFSRKNGSGHGSRGFSIFLICRKMRQRPSCVI